MTIPSCNRLRAAAAALLATAALAACTSEPVDNEPPAEFIAVKVAWQPGERAAFLNRVMTNHELVFLYAGDVSDLAPQLFADPDSHVVIIANPLASASLTGPISAQLRAPELNASWIVAGLKITTINNNPVPPDTIFWHLVTWTDPANANDHGFAIAFSRLAAFNATPTNATLFDASGGKVGAATGEFHTSTGTMWLDNANQGIYRVNSQTYPGAFAPVTSGPYLGGQSRAGTQFGRIFNSVLTRVSGAEAPVSYTLNFDFRTTGIPSVEILCVFPTPCTTNVPAIAALHRTVQR